MSLSFFKYPAVVVCLFLVINTSFSANCISRSDSLIISRQSQLDSFPVNYPGCTRITGKLIISGNNITNFQRLNVLTYVESLNVSYNPLIISLYGLNNIRSAGNIEISHNDALLSLNGLEGLDSVTNNLEVKYNLRLITMDGLNSLKKVKNTLSIFTNSSLTNLDGLESVKSVSRLSVYGNPSLTSLLGMDSTIKLKTIDIWVNESLSCCYIVNNIKANNPAILLSNIFSNDAGCSSVSEITSSSGNQGCCKSEFSVLTNKICAGESISVGANIYSVTGIYIDSFVTSKGCDSIIYTDLSIGQPSLTVVEKELCSGQNFLLSNGRQVNTSGLFLDTIPFTCDSVVEYRLSFIDKTIINTSKSVCEGQTYRLRNGKIITESGIYTDTVRNSLSCDSIFITEINFFPNTFTVSLNSNEIVTAGDSLKLIPLYNGGIPVDWYWSASNDLSCIYCEHPVAKPLQNTIYELKVRTETGCEDTASIIITVPVSSISVPDAFTPNGDRINDDLDVFIAAPQLYLIKIFNRYGELVFFSNDLNSKWNGMYKNENCPSDSYVYIIDATLSGQQKLQKKGTVLLLR